MLENFMKRHGLREPDWSSFIFRWLMLSLGLHLIASFQSTGFFHTDEHFQIAEFVNAKLGRSPIVDLPIEFREHMRPWLLPALLTGLTQILIKIGFQSPFEWATAYRLLSSLMGWSALVALSLCCYHWFSNLQLRKNAVMASTLLWYLPAFHARHSSENWGGSFFFLGLSLLFLDFSTQNQKHLIEKSNKDFFYLGTGLIFGLAFEFRYQVALMIAGILVWSLIIAKLKIRSILLISLGIIGAIALGTWVDYWGYSTLCFAPWNYFKYNLIENHFQSDIAPWWDYFRRSITESWPILGVLTLISFIVAWLKNPKHVLTWSLAPFFILHLMIGHKELRFLFPMAHAGGILLIQSISELKTLKTFHRLIIGYNLIALLCLILTPAWMPIRFYEKLYSLQSTELLIYYKDNSINNFGGAIMNFYFPKNIKFKEVINYQDFRQILQDKKDHWFFSPYNLLTNSTSGETLSLIQACNIKISTLPNWLNIFNYRKFFNNMTNWTLYRCRISSL